MTDVRDTIRQFILATHLQGESPSNLRDDTPLWSGGILDSIGTLGLINFLEKEFDIQLEAHETGAANFDRIQDIAALVERKRSE